MDKIQDRLLRCERSKVLDKAFKALNATLSVFSHNSRKHLINKLISAHECEKGFEALQLYPTERYRDNKISICLTKAHTSNIE